MGMIIAGRSTICCKMSETLRHVGDDCGVLATRIHEKPLRSACIRWTLRRT
ncbi:hypothetical protein PY32053_01344 [Paracoccus yeei]|uniref:Uncharacterized protein n=1 Tax=Paracoccus yeei TaxID=147645 RepID=A0A386ULH2_9RHOB|nr:hypothetical protein PY32053_01344 [Paracoccus yeei]